MFRFLLIFAMAALAWVFVDARWEEQNHVLSLRVRSADEVRAQAFERARNLGRDWVRSWAQGQPAPVSAPGPRESGSGRSGDQSLRGALPGEPRRS